MTVSKLPTLNYELQTTNDKKYLWHPFDVFRTTENIFIERSEGIHLHTPDGRVIKDMVSSWWTNLHGHNHPYIVQTIQKQLNTLSHIIFSGFTHEPAILLAQRLIEILPGKMDKVFLSDNGSTAVEVGLKMAIQYWHNAGQSKKKILAFEGCYHGDTFGAMSLAGAYPFNEPFESYLFEVVYLPFPNGQNSQAITDILKRELATENIAALVYEPMIQGVGGMRLFDQQTLDDVLQLAHSHEVLLIADEVMTGFGRTGKLFASDYLKTQPDIVCLSKGITGGFLALGATAANERVYKKFETNEKKKIFLHGHSYTGNALACASANASLDLLLKQDCLEKIANISKWQQEAVQKFAACGKVEKVFALGTILSITLKEEISSGYFASIAEEAYQYFLGHNILLRPMGNVLYLSPPYCVTEQEIQEAQSLILAYASK